MSITFDRLVVAGDLRFDRFVDVTGAPFIESISGAQDGAALTITGTSFSVSGNSVYEGNPDDESETPLEIAVDTESATQIVTDVLDASVFFLTRATSFFVRNSLGVASNVVSVTIAPATGQRAFAVTQEFLGDASTRIESDPPLTYGDEIRIRNVLGADISDPDVTGQGAFHIDDGATSFEAAVFDGEELGAWATQTIQNLVTTAAVPDVEDLTQAAATADIESAGLVAAVVSSVPHTTVTIGSVIAQFPAAGEELPLGGTVELTLSLGNTVTLVPNLAGFSQAEAESLRTAAGLAGTAYRYIDGNNTGTVINQSIAPGTLVDVGTALDLAISSNLMPDLSGELIQSATAIIAAANLTLDDAIAEAHSDLPPGTVISQDPVADATVAPLDPVTLTVSLGAVSSVNITATQTGYTVAVTSQANGTAYVVAVPRNSDPPLADEIAAGMDGEGNTALASASISVTADIEAQLSLSGVSVPKTDIYSTVYDGVDFSNVESSLNQLKSAPNGRQYTVVA